jgi:hypothetical protein
MNVIHRTDPTNIVEANEQYMGFSLLTRFYNKECVQKQ